jgi:transcriptional regulator with XRE-family HTH domain
MPKAEAKPRVHDIDALVGSRIRARRLALKMDQETLGRALGLKAQEIKDYESGATRVRASRLSVMAEALDVPILFFFEDLQTNRNTEPSDPELQNDQVEQSRAGVGV